MEKIHKVAAMVIVDDKFIMVRKTGKGYWTSLGGKIEKGETEEEALIREIREELGCAAEILSKLDDFTGHAIFDDAELILSVYLTNLIGEPHVTDSEIEEFIWIDQDYEEKGIKLTDTIINGVIPYCIKNNLLNWSKNGKV